MEKWGNGTGTNGKVVPNCLIFLRFSSNFLRISHIFSTFPTRYLWHFLTFSPHFPPFPAATWLIRLRRTPTPAGPSIHWDTPTLALRAVRPMALWAVKEERLRPHLGGSVVGWRRPQVARLTRPPQCRPPPLPRCWGREHCPPPPPPPAHTYAPPHATGRIAAPMETSKGVPLCPDPVPRPPPPPTGPRRAPSTHSHGGIPHPPAPLVRFSRGEGK